MSSPLDQSEVDALMQAIQEGRVSSGDGKGEEAPVLGYDLTSQERIIRGQMPTLDSIDDRIASMFGGALSARMRMELRVAATPASLLKFSDVAALLAPPSTVGLMSLGPGHGLGAVILDGGLAKALVAGALGDRKARADAQEGAAKAEITNVERLVLKHLLGMLCEAMHTSWADILAIKPEVLRFEGDPRMAMIAAPSDLAILCGFEMAGAASGRLQVVIPYATVEPVKKLLSSPPRQAGAQDASFMSRLSRELLDVKLQIRAEMGRAKVSFSRLLELQVGDLIALDGSEQAPVPVYVQGRRKLQGAPRVVGGNLAVVLEQGLRSKEKPEAERGARSAGQGGQGGHGGQSGHGKKGPGAAAA
jgi:flagellar motor switch protein FliM